MVIQDQNTKNELNSSERRPLTLRLSFAKNQFPDLADAIDFVLEKLQFLPIEKFFLIDYPADETLQLKDFKGNQLTLILGEIEEKKDFNYIIFHTDDCLRDYHKYTHAGVEFISRPEYIEAGLRVDFLGTGENRYTLLEERIYTDI